MQPTPLHIIVSPLDWGLGHASRCIPVIKQLLEAGHHVTLAGSGRSILLLQNEFPALETIQLIGFSPTFENSSKMIWQLFKKLPEFIRAMYSENRALKKILKHGNFDVVISDNRYGLRNKSTWNIIITHQVMIKTPIWLRFAEFPLYLISKWLISRFDECWIPDHEYSPGLSGDLSHKYRTTENAKFVGPLSRFSEINKSEKKEEGLPNKIAVVLSGTEPQRSDFENLIRNQLPKLSLPVTLIAGKPGSTENHETNGNLTILQHASCSDIYRILENSSLVICRSGYSSIMDLEALGKRALFIPTLGQTEQEYLAKLHKQQGIALWRKQSELDLRTDIAIAMSYPGFTKNDPPSGLKNAISLLQKK